MAGINYNIEGASSLFPQSAASQVANETDEQRRKRLQALQASKQLPSGMSSLAQNYGAALSTGV